MRRRAGTAVAAAVLIAGCGGAPSSAPPANPPSTPTAGASPPAPPRPPDDVALLQRLLLERAQAIEAGDADRLASTSAGAQRARDRRHARAAGRLPLAAVELFSGAIAPVDGRVTLRVKTRYRFAGVDSRFLVRSTMRAIRTPSGWRVQDDRPSGIAAPWQLGTYVARRSPHFLALTPKGLAPDGLMADLEAGRRKMQQALPGIKVPPRLLVIVARGTADTRALTRDVRALSALTAMAEASIREDGPAERVTVIDAQRLLILWRSFGRQDHDRRRQTVAHELTHASLLRRNSGRMPAWLVEGMAMYASGDARYGAAGAVLGGARLRDPSKQRAVKRVLSLTALGRADSLTKLGAVPLSFAYSYSAGAAYAIASTHGTKGLLRLYSAFGDERIAGRAGRKLTDRVMRRTLHRSFASVQREVDAFVRAHASF